MATYNQIAYDILEIVKGNQISDDVDISIPHIMYHINNQRALWIRNEYNKPGRKVDQHLVQDLGCLELTTVDAAECCSVTTDCVALRTKNKIPAFIELHNGVALTRVGPVNKLKPPFNLTSYAQAPYMSANKYTGNTVNAFVLNDYVYILTNDVSMQTMDYINVQGIVADPEVLVDYHCESSGDPCFSYDDEYPMNTWMIPYIKEQVLAQFGLSLQTPKDEGNNAKDDSQAKS
jgi:hypothetical protein